MAVCAVVQRVGERVHAIAESQAVIAATVEEQSVVTTDIGERMASAATATGKICEHVAAVELSAHHTYDALRHRASG